MYRSYSALFNLQPGSSFIIRVLPSCGGILKREETRTRTLEEQDEAKSEDLVIKRQEPEGDLQTIQGSNNTFIRDPRPGAPEGSGFVIVPISEAASGHYDVQFSLSSPAENMSIVDGSGIEYAR